MTKTIPLSQLTLALGLAIGLAGCETVSDAASSVGDTVASAASAMDPTTWFGGDDNTPPPDDTSQTASADTNASTTPDLANLPARPPTSTPAQQQAAAQSLAADGAQARYSADTLRAGTEAAAPPPAAMDVPPSTQAAAPSAAPSAGPASNDAPPTTDSSTPPTTRVAVAAPTANDAPPTADNAPPSAAAVPAPAAAPAPSAAPVVAPPPAALTQGTAAVPTGAVPANRVVQTAAIAPVRAVAPRPGAEPAVPAVPPSTAVRGAAMGGQVMSDAALGFKPSAAPPLDPSINQWVSAPIVARYRQTASNSIAPTSQPAVPPKGVVPNAGGAVAANFDAISNGAAGGAAAMGGGPLPAAVVYFPGDGTTLSPAARALIKNTVSQYKAMGGAGSIRVVGHSSSRTSNMPVEKHLELIFEKSQQRASAVAQELIHEGIPADHVLIEAVGDSQPVYYESMPQGEEGNRRAEIFVQS